MNVHTILASGALLALAGCATGDQTTNLAETETADPRRGDEVRNICFASSIDGFGESTRNTVVVSEGMDQYLVETYHRCFDLDFAQSLKIDSTLGCLSRGDTITPFDSVFGNNPGGAIPQRCTVKAIYEWNADAVTEEATTETSDAEPA